MDRVRAVGRAVVAELDPGDQRHGAAADAVEQRDHLRHRGHLHLARRGHADGGAERDAERDQPPVALAGVQQRRDHGDRHADGGDAVAAHGGRRPGEPAQPLDEQREGDDVEDVDEAFALQERGGERSRRSPALSPSPVGLGLAVVAPSFAGRLGLDLNISSMRSVTRKPPTMLIVPKAIAITSSTLLSASSCRPGRPAAGRRAARSRGSRSCPTSAACAACWAPSRSRRSR